jgi:3-hydroxyacyl-[acyl-carrier-protein] dehydratase
MELSKKQILQYQKNSDPYLFIDYVTDLKLGSYAEGYKNLDINEWFFKVHWPGDPNMPGFLQLESMTQLCALTILGYEKNRGKVVYLTGADKIKFYKKVIPPTKLVIKTKLISYKNGIGRGSGECYIEQNIVSKALFSFVFPEDIVRVKQF